MKLRQKFSRREACSFLDESVVIQGELRFEGTLRVGGTLFGSVMTPGCLIVLPEARIEATVQAGDVTVYGSLIGDVACDPRVEICDGAVLSGNVRSPQLAIEEGGRFDGTSLRSAEPQDGQ